MANFLTSAVLSGLAAGITLGAFAQGCGDKKRGHFTPAPPSADLNVPADQQSQNTLPRSMLDRPDDYHGAQFHLTYALPLDGADSYYDVNGHMTRSADYIQDWLSACTGKELRIDTHQGRYDITFVRVPILRNDQSLLSAAIVNTLDVAIAGAGLNDPHKKYIIYYDGPNNYAYGAAYLDGRVATIHLRAGNQPLCSENIGGDHLGVLHEAFHSLGAVNPLAPHYDFGRPGHTTEPGDLMNKISSDLQVDPGNDDYFGHGRTDIPDLKNSAYLRPSTRSQTQSAQRTQKHKHTSRFGSRQQRHIAHRAGRR